MRVVGLQVVAMLALTLLALAWGADAAKAVFLGGAVALVPNGCFAWAVVRSGGSASEQGAVLAGGRLFGQWLAKVALTVALMVLIFANAQVSGLGFFIGLGVTLLVPLAAPLVAAAN